MVRIVRYTVYVCPAMMKRRFKKAKKKREKKRAAWAERFAAGGCGCCCQKGAFLPFARKVLHQSGTFFAGLLALNAVTRQRGSSGVAAAQSGRCNRRSPRLQRCPPQSDCDPVARKTRRPCARFAGGHVAIRYYAAATSHPARQQCTWAQKHEGKRGAVVVVGIVVVVGGGGRNWRGHRRQQQQ